MVKNKPEKKPLEQYDHKDKERINNPPVGLVTSETDKETGKKTYAYDPHLDPQLQWAGKAEHTSFEVPTISLHVHERIDPITIIDAVRKRNGKKSVQLSLFESAEENPPLREAIEFYKHKHNWSNRLIAGDSLLVMNSLLEKEGLAGKVQMIYIDPPYGIHYKSNFQPFVNKREVSPGDKDEDLTQEPEMIKAFRDTWELGIHSYLTYLRDRLFLSWGLLKDEGNIFVQISDENLHLVQSLMDDVFDSRNFVALIAFTKAGGGLQATSRVSSRLDYIIWYSKDKKNMSYFPLFVRKEDPVSSGYQMLQLPNGDVRPLTTLERSGKQSLPKGAKLFMSEVLTKPGPGSKYEIEYEGKIFDSGRRWWGTPKESMLKLIEKKRVLVSGKTLRAIRYLDDFPYSIMDTLWSGIGGQGQPVYVVQTNTEIVQRCMLMTTKPGDLVFDPTCGSCTTAYVAEQWGRRWITCDTSRVAITLSKQRLMTALFEYYKLAYPEEGVGSGFKYKIVPHITLKSIANDEPPAEETLYDQPFTDNSKARVSGPFTVEAVPAPVVKPLSEVKEHPSKDESVARSGETLRQSEWRGELFRTGIRGKSGQRIEFSRVEMLPGTRWLHADAETKEDNPQRAVVSFGPEHAPLEQRQVELAIEEARRLVPKPKIIVFASFQFDPEAAKDIDETEWPGVTLLKAQMNADLLTEDLKKKRASNESFWLMGQPDVRAEKIKDGKDKGKYRVEVLGFDSMASLWGWKS